jgi:hypothetical protein
MAAYLLLAGAGIAALGAGETATGGPTVTPTVNPLSASQ